MSKFLLLILVCVPALGLAQVPYNTNPDWRSTDRRYATGGSIFDLNKDGWPEFVVSNGNDMRSEKNGVYVNANGTLPLMPTWESADLGKQGHLAIGDYDQDGWQDVAVAVLNPTTGAPGVKVYRNNLGVLSSSPAWVSANNFYGWHVAWGDPDMDGDLDLLAGTSDVYSARQWKNFMYKNNNGVLETTPSWQTVDERDLDHMEFCDVDNDGDLDIVAIGSTTCNWIYRNTNGVISTVPDWQSTDNNNQMANTLAIGDVTGDGYRDLIMTDNNQVGGGSGYVKLYRNNRLGGFEQVPGWKYFAGYVSGVALADVNGDGRLDLAMGAWWNPTRIFLNNGTGFNNTPSWTSSISQVVEMIAFGDVNRDGIRTVSEWKNRFTGATRKTPILSGGPIEVALGRKLYSLDHQPIEKLDRVVVDGRVLGLTEYTFNPLTAYVTLKDAPTRSVRIDYTYSQKPDMLVTDWENNGNVVYLWH